MAHISTIKIENTVAEICPITFDGEYKGDEVQQRVLEIQGYPSVRGWSILDVMKDENGVDELALAHYDDDSTATYGNLRGDVIDLEVGAVIAKSFGYTPTAVVDTLDQTDGLINIKDKEGIVHTFDPATCHIKRGVECVVFRAVKRKGKMHLFTHKRLTPEGRPKVMQDGTTKIVGQSRWGSSPSFISMYQEAGGPTEDQLFDASKPFSSTCYVFAVVHPALLVGTRQVVTKPYIVHLASFTMDIKRPDDQVAPGIATFASTSVIGGSVNESFIHSPPDLSLDQANYHLKFGYYDDPTAGQASAEDPRLQTGEMLIIYSTNESGDIIDIVKVHSPSYEWRVTMRGNNPNILNQFYSMLGLVYKDLQTRDDWTALCEKLIPFPPYAEESIKQLFSQTRAILRIPPGVVGPDDYTSRDSRIHLLWMNFVLSLPPNLQEGALDILSKFKKERTAVTEWLQHLEEANKDIEQVDLPARVKGIISISRRLARDRVNNHNNYSAKGAHMSLRVVIKSTIRNLICKEDGPSLYRLVRAMKEAQNPAAASS
jgi:hypothetical protein